MFDPVAWDPYLHAWVVTSYNDAVTVLQNFSAARVPDEEQARKLGLSDLEPMAAVMVKQMLFMDAPAHTKLRGLCAAAFTSRKVETLSDRIEAIANELVDAACHKDKIDLIEDIAAPLPAIVTAELLGLDRRDHRQLKQWSADFAEVLGNFQHNPDRIVPMLRSLSEMIGYFSSVMSAGQAAKSEGLIYGLMSAELDGARLTSEEIIANIIVTMVGGQETTTNLIGNGMLTLLRHPAKLELLRRSPEMLESAIEELLRFESPSQHTARIAREDMILGGKHLRQRDAVIAVMAAANRDPARFAMPDELDLQRANNRHLAFGWGPHFCFGAPLARLEGRIVLATLLRRLPYLRLLQDAPRWRENLGLRGLTSLYLSWRPATPALS